MVRLGVAAAAAMVVLVLVAAAVRLAWAPVERRTLETFARRQKLRVTVANGPLLLQSLMAQDMYLAGAFVLLICALTLIG